MALTPEFNQWRDNLEPAKRDLVDVLTVNSRHVRAFILTLFDYISRDNMAQVLSIGEASRKDPVSQIAAIIQSALKKSLLNDIGRALVDYENAEPLILTDALRKLTIEERRILSRYVQLP